MEAPANVVRDVESVPVVRARGLTKVYRTGGVEVHALRGVDLDPYAGEHVYRDHDLLRADDAERTRYLSAHVGFVFQFDNRLPALTARENVELVHELVPTGMPADEAFRVAPCARLPQGTDREAPPPVREPRGPSPSPS